MPSGQTHDRITLWTLPVVAGLTYGQTHNSDFTLLVSGGYLFGGLMFGPDLDIYSRQFQRWGKLRWIWIPYQNSLRHRSFLSHGPIVGTALRSLYLCGWIVLFGGLGLALAHFVWGESWRWLLLGESAIASFQQYYREWIALYIGLELGAMSHSLSDWGSSFYKRFQGQKSKTVTTTKRRRVRGTVKKRTAINAPAASRRVDAKKPK